MAEFNPFACLTNKKSVRLMPLPRYPNDEKIPPRKPHCKNYDECLDEAARKNKCFCCTGCRNFRKRTEKTLLCSDELINIYTLWREVFQSDSDSE